MTAAERLAAAVVCERLRDGLTVESQVSGRSMFPYLAPGCRVMIEPRKAAFMSLGDLVAFERDGRVVLHRVVGVDVASRTIREKGDNVRQSTLVPPEQVLGCVTIVTARRSRILSRVWYRATGRWLASFSVWHEWCHSVSTGRGFSLQVLAHFSTLLIRTVAYVLRPR